MLPPKRFMIQLKVVKKQYTETVDILRQQFSDELDHKAVEGRVVNVKDSF